MIKNKPDNEEDSKVKIISESFRLPEEKHKEVKEYCKQNGMTFQLYMEMLIDNVRPYDFTVLRELVQDMKYLIETCDQIYQVLSARESLDEDLIDQIKVMNIERIRVWQYIAAFFASNQ